MSVSRDGSPQGPAAEVKTEHLYQLRRIGITLINVSLKVADRTPQDGPCTSFVGGCGSGTPGRK